MSELRRLVRQEIKARREFLVGTVLLPLEVRPYDATMVGAPTWTTSVEVSSTRVLEEVPVKAGSDGSRAYAALGATVLLRRNAQGRFEVVGPGDRVAAFQEVKEYDFGVPTPTTTQTVGFTTRREPFEFYQGSGPPNSLWNDGVTPFPKTTIVDPNGNPV